MTAESVSLGSGGSLAYLHDMGHLVKRTPYLCKAFVGSVWEESKHTLYSGERWKAGLSTMIGSRLGLCARIGIRTIDVMKIFLGSQYVSSIQIKVFYQCLQAAKVGSSPVECFSVLVRLSKNVGKLARCVYQAQIPDIYVFVLIIFRGLSFLAKVGCVFDYFVEYGALVLPYSYPNLLFWKKMVGTLPSFFLLFIRTIELVSWGVYVETYDPLSNRDEAWKQRPYPWRSHKKPEVISKDTSTPSVPQGGAVPINIQRDPLPKKQIQLYATFLASEWTQEFIGTVAGLIELHKMDIIHLAWIDPVLFPKLVLLLSVAGLIIKVASTFVEEPDFKFFNNPGYVKPVSSEVKEFLQENDGLWEKFQEKRVRYARPAFVLPDTD